MAGVDKRTLRREFLRRRKLLSRAEVDRRSAAISRHLMDLLGSLGPLRGLHCFLPIERNREVNTWPIVKALLEKGKVVLISTTDFDTQSMQHYYYDLNLEFTTDPLGIPSPINAKPATLTDCECILMPLVVADKNGGRIGYGGGYYDRLLNGTGELLKIGLSMGPVLDKITFLEPHDVTLDYCITPTETIDCKHG
ncbi:MAG: 5-formyltetrahydrofolate cyclo-ligase [Bacteroidota bacterium]